MRSDIFKLFSGNLISKILGFIREMIFAGSLGTGAEMGAFRVAQTGTLVPINFLTSDSLNSAFIPLYKKFRNYEDGDDLVKTYTWIMLGIFFIISILLSSLVYFGANFWVSILAPGFDGSVKSISANMLDIMGYGIPAYIISALGVFICIANDDFVPMALRPSVQNVGMLAGAILYLINYDPRWLAWGFTISYMAFLVYVTGRLLSQRHLNFPGEWRSPDVAIILSSFWSTIKPLIFLPILSQGNIAIERAVASLIGLVAVSALDYAKFTTETIFFLISMPVAFVGLSSWSGISYEQVSIKVANTSKAMLYIAIPLSSIVAENSGLIVNVLFARGRFDSISSQVTTDILTGMAFGIWAQSVGYVLIKALSATFKNRTVLLVMAVSLVINSIFNILLYRVFGSLTLGLSNSMYAIVSFLLCVKSLQLWDNIKGVLGVYFVASIVLFLFVLICTSLFDSSKFVVFVISCSFWVFFSFLYAPSRCFFTSVFKAK